MNDMQFEDFLNILKTEEYPLASTINDLYISSGCTRIIKESASGYTISYLSGKTKKHWQILYAAKPDLKLE